MKKNTLFLFITILLAPAIAGAATCSRANLTRCLDSACAINISSNPAARCQYCGTSSAGEAPSGGMKSVSVGASAKFNIPDKELKKAPTDAGQRYAWASKRCLEIVSGCTTDDIEETYDTLIEQSCTAAGISAQMASLRQTASATKSESTCQSQVTSCVMADNACGKNFTNCKSDADFDKYFASCGVTTGGCDEFLNNIRTKLATNRSKTEENVLVVKIIPYVKHVLIMYAIRIWQTSAILHIQMKNQWQRYYVNSMTQRAQR